MAMMTVLMAAMKKAVMVRKFPSPLSYFYMYNSAHTYVGTGTGMFEWGRGCLVLLTCLYLHR